MFRTDPSLSIAGTSLIREVMLAPAFLVQRFGPPGPSDPYKCTGSYTFTAMNRTGGDGDGPFTVYEYKSTTAYHGEDADVPTPEAFWRSRDEHRFSIGGRAEEDDGSADVFIQWLLSKYERWRRTDG